MGILTGCGTPRKDLNVPQSRKVKDRFVLGCRNMAVLCLHANVPSRSKHKQNPNLDDNTVSASHSAAIVSAMTAALGLQMPVPVQCQWLECQFKYQCYCQGCPRNSVVPLGMVVVVYCWTVGAVGTVGLGCFCFGGSLFGLGLGASNTSPPIATTGIAVWGG